MFAIVGSWRKTGIHKAATVLRPTALERRVFRKTSIFKLNQGTAGYHMIKEITSHLDR